MLVLSRKQDEKVVIGDNITITVIEICDESGRCIEGKVRLGIDAPIEISVDRSEVRAKRIQNSKPVSEMQPSEERNS